MFEHSWAKKERGADAWVPHHSERRGGAQLSVCERKKGEGARIGPGEGGRPHAQSGLRSWLRGGGLGLGQKATRPRGKARGLARVSLFFFISNFLFCFLFQNIFPNRILFKNT